MAAKKAEKSRPKSRHKPVPQPHGGALVPGAGRGPAKGAPNAGRPPNWLKEFCDDLLADKKAKAQVSAIIKDKNHPAYATMWKALADRAAGKPVQAHEHRLGATLEELVAGSQGKAPA